MTPKTFEKKYGFKPKRKFVELNSEEAKSFVNILAKDTKKFKKYEECFEHERLRISSKYEKEIDRIYDKHLSSYMRD